MDDFLRLILLSLAMFIGCYVSGSIPLILSLSEVGEGDREGKIEEGREVHAWDRVRKAIMHDSMSRV